MGDAVEGGAWRRAGEFGAQAFDLDEVNGDDGVAFTQGLDAHVAAVHRLAMHDQPALLHVENPYSGTPAAA